jgi:hypothetical protein
MPNAGRLLQVYNMIPVWCHQTASALSAHMSVSLANRGPGGVSADISTVLVGTTRAMGHGMHCDHAFVR